MGVKAAQDGIDQKELQNSELINKLRALTNSEKNDLARGVDESLRQDVQTILSGYNGIIETWTPEQETIRSKQILKWYDGLAELQKANIKLFVNILFIKAQTGIANIDLSNLNLSEMELVGLTYLICEGLDTNLSNDFTLREKLADDVQSWGKTKKGSILAYLQKNEGYYSPDFLLGQVVKVIGKNVLVRDLQGKKTSKKLNTGDEVVIYQGRMVQIKNKKRTEYFIRIGEDEIVSANFLKMPEIPANSPKQAPMIGAHTELANNSNVRQIQSLYTPEQNPPSAKEVIDAANRVINTQPDKYKDIKQALNDDGFKLAVVQQIQVIRTSQA